LKAHLRNLAITVVVAVVAGTAGGWLGAGVRNGGDADAQTLPLRQTVSEIVRKDINLSPDQKKEIETIEASYYERRAALRHQVAGANHELADALMNDMAFGREAQVATNHVEQGLGELQRATVMYVLQVRDILNMEQQVIYDRKVREVLTATASAPP
jgi:hypothetical protein